MKGIVLGFVFVIIAIIVICVAYYVSAAYQQTLSVSVNFEDTYRYVSNLSDGNGKNKFKIERVEISVTGSVKKDAGRNSTIIPANHVRKAVMETLISHYANCLLVQETDIFVTKENSLKKYPLVITPTLENLSVLFFNKLSDVMPELGCQLASVTLESEGVKVSHSRYKISDYNV